MWMRFLQNLALRYGLIIVWLAVIAVFSLAQTPGFLTGDNFRTIFGSQAVLLIVSLAFMLPATAGELDVSVAGTLGIGMILTMYLTVEHGWPLLAATFAVITVGALVGFLNAILIVEVGIMSLIATLGTGTVLTGLGYFVTPSVLAGQVGGLSTLTNTQYFGVPMVFYYGLALTVVLWYIYAWTPLGRKLFFVGVSADVARLSGVNVRRIKFGTLISSGVISALAGLMLAGTLGSSSPDAARDYLFPAFAAAFLGSTAITPGRFNPWGTFIAVFFLVSGITGLQLLGYVGWVPQVFYGASLVIAVAISRLLARSEAAEAVAVGR